MNLIFGCRYPVVFRGGAWMKAQTIEGPVGASPACCHSEADGPRYVLNLWCPILDAFQGWAGGPAFALNL
jgi:hypothetical protein